MNNVDLLLMRDNSKIWLGDYYTSQNEEFLKEHNITVIINCTRDAPFIYSKRIISNAIFTGLRIPILDNESDYENKIMQENLPKVIEFIKNQMNKQQNILIHCMAGVSRSASVVAALLFTLISDYAFQNNITTNQDDLMNNVLIYILEKRPQVFFYGTHLNFKKALVNYCKLSENFNPTSIKQFN